MSDSDLTRQALPPINLLDAPASVSYFKTRENETYFFSQAGVAKRRNYHEIIIEVFGEFLEVSSDKKSEVLINELLLRSNHGKISQRVINEKIDWVKLSFPRAFESMEINLPLTFNNLKRGYRAAALKHHPDLGGAHADMISINEVYAELHALIIDVQQISQNENAIFTIIGRDGTPLKTCKDYRYYIARQLFDVHLDDWSVDEAYRMLKLLQTEEWTKTQYTSSPERLIELVEDVAKLASRLALADLQKEARYCLKIVERGVKIAKAEGLTYEHFLDNAAKTVGGKGRRVAILNHRRQANNAFRLGIINKQRLDDLKKNFSCKEEAENASDVAIQEIFSTYVKNVGFLQDLPPDEMSLGKMVKQRLVPEPHYYQTQVNELSDDQQAEYAKAFSAEASLFLVRKYLFVRLQSLLESVILHKHDVGFEVLEREARALSQFRLRWGSPEIYAVKIADAFQYLSNLGKEHCAERLACLKLLHEHPKWRITPSYPIGSDFIIRIAPEYFEIIRLPLVELRAETRRL